MQKSHMMNKITALKFQMKTKSGHQFTELKSTDNEHKVCLERGIKLGRTDGGECAERAGQPLRLSDSYYNNQINCWHAHFMTILG